MQLNSANDNAGEAQVMLPIRGMTCGSCVAAVENAILQVPEVSQVHVNLATEQATVKVNVSKVILLQLFQVVRQSGYAIGTDRVSFDIENVTSSSKATQLEKLLFGYTGVISAEVMPAISEARVEFVPNVISHKELACLIEQAGYSIKAPKTDIANQQRELDRLNKVQEVRELRLKFMVAALGAAALFLSSFNGFPWTANLMGHTYYLIILWMVATVVQFWAGSTFYQSGIANLRHRPPNMYTLIALGTGAAYLYSVAVLLLKATGSNTLLISGVERLVYFDTSAIIIALVLLGRLLETQAKSQTATAIHRLIALKPIKANVVREGIEEEVPADQVVSGDLVIVRPGEIVPVDGLIVEGHSWMEEAMVTGESVPTEKYINSVVLGATINTTGLIKFRATRVGKDTLLSQVIRLVEEAQGSKIPIQRLTDSIASYFVPTILSIALAAFIVWVFLGPTPTHIYALLTFVAVLIIACPCAIGLAIPTAILVGTGKGAEHGILIRSAESLEKAHKVTIVVLDKTGTLTIGKPSVTNLVHINGDDRELLRVAASAESGSEHPLGDCIVRKALEEGVSLTQPTNFQAIPGQGIQADVNGTDILLGNHNLMKARGIRVSDLTPKADALASQGKTIMFLANNGYLMGLIAVSDKVKSDAKYTVSRLKSLGLEPMMLTGDNCASAQTLARTVGIDKVISDAQPFEKTLYVKQLQDRGEVVAMVGDGINDAPSLARADVSVAMGTGTDIAINSADIVLVRGDLGGLTAVFDLSRRTMQTIKQNLFWAFFYNVALIPVAAGVLYPIFNSIGGVPENLGFFLGDTGFLNPVLAALAMAFSSVSVISNSLRLRSFRLG